MKTKLASKPLIPAKAVCGSDGSCRSECQTEKPPKRGSKQRPPPQEMRSKEEVLAYRLPQLVKRLQKELGLSEHEAKALFMDTLRFLFMCATDTKGRSFSPSKMIDEGWHHFIMFTMEYEKFCYEHFGFFIHHRPFTDEEQVTASRKPSPTRAVARKLFGKLSKNWSGQGGDCDSCAACDNCGSCRGGGSGATTHSSDCMSCGAVNKPISG